MSQDLKIAIPLGETGTLCFLDPNLISYIQDQNIQVNEIEIQKKNIYTIILIESDESNFSVLRKNFPKQNIVQYLPNSGIDFFDKILVETENKNFLILYSKNINSSIICIGQLLLSNDPSLEQDDLFQYLELNFPNSDYKKDILNFSKKLDESFYHFKKEDKKNLKLINFNHNTIQQNKELYETEYNLSALDLPASDESIFETNPRIHFNLSSLQEKNFDELTVGSFTDESNALEMNISSELQFIESIDEKENIIDIATEPLVLIDEKSGKKHIDFDAILDDEIEQGMQDNEIVFGMDSLKESDFFESKSENDFRIDEIIQEELGDEFAYDTEILHSEFENVPYSSELKKDSKVDLSFPKPLESIQFVSNENSFDPTHTFISKRIQDVILNEVLNEKDTNLEKKLTPVSFRAIQLED